MGRVPVAVQGWDSRTEVVDDVWVERTPRRPAVRAALLRETRLMPRLAPLLPLSVPVPLVVEDDRPWRVRHRLVPGEPGAGDGPPGRRGPPPPPDDVVARAEALLVRATGSADLVRSGTEGVVTRLRWLG